ncbi:MAG: tetratricopeptide repeat protein [Segetibacter sp.]|nr:tetratricopeptide repeat protein [Segetibacter sp.]
MNKTSFVFTILFFLLGYSAVHAQPGAEIEVKKPAKYENRRLASEKTGEKKFTIPRKLYQNTVTHYNYYFNANNRLNEVVSQAKTVFRDDYSQLLPFYNYTLEVTAQNKVELDSIIYKCTAGILLHDLRNSWIDNMYLILAKAYFFRNDLDSAGLTLQYLNFSYAPKEEGGYDIPIGSNSSNEKGEFSIATKEKNSIWTKLTSRPPSRNESFIWQIRNHIEKNELPEAAGVIEILRNDPNFPKRLHTDLHEVLAYWFYKQQAYDSAANYLSKSLNEATNIQEKARWEYLIAQMYQLANKNENAVEFYNRSIAHTTDPVMDVYARLNSIRIKRTDKKDYLQENIDALLKMARRDKYEAYRDIIYYAAANIELERNNFTNAQDDLLKSVKYTTNNPAQRSQSFLLLADLNYNRKSFVEASNFYDSLDVNVLGRQEDKDRVTFRKPPLKIVAENSLTIIVQDSLQALAKLPAEQRDAIIKKQEKLFRKAQGLKEEDQQGSVNTAVKQVPDLFADNSGSKSNEFYFYNASLKARGFSEFKARWGERPNTDNWRRKSALDKQAQSIADVDDVSATPTGSTEQKPLDNSYEGLQANIPLTGEKLDASNKSIMDALFTLGQTFSGKLEEYPSAIQAYEELLRRFPNSQYKSEALFNLVYGYQKTGDKAKSDQLKNMLLTDTANNRWTNLIKNPNIGKNDVKATGATKQYENIYNLFIEGNFEKAKSEKRVADSLYGNSFWTPQLLFIESIYYIKQKEDSTAIKVLTDLSTLHAGNPMAERAKTMIDVLRRRKDIEEYLTRLNITRNQTKPTEGFQRTAAPITKPVDKPVNPTDLTVSNAPDSTVVTKTPGPVAADSTIVANDPDTVADTTVITAPVVVNNFSFVASDSQYVVILLDKVDPVYASEARNAFNRFNKEKYYNQQIDITSLQLDERFNLVMEGPFTNAATALDYIENVRPVAKSRILPWLSIDRYSFIVISNANLNVLKTNKDMEAYKQLLQKAFPGKF